MAGSFFAGTRASSWTEVRSKIIVKGDGILYMSYAMRLTRASPENLVLRAVYEIASSDLTTGCKFYLGFERDPTARQCLQVRGLLGNHVPEYDNLRELDSIQHGDTIRIVLDPENDNRKYVFADIHIFQDGSKVQIVCVNAVDPPT